MYSDAHTHITGNPFGENVLTPQEIETVLKRIRDRGVSFIVAGGHDLDSSKKVTEIAVREDMVYASVGVHPWIAASINDHDYESFLDLTKNSKVAAIGEIGLDDSRSRADRETQVECLVRQLRLARESGLPPIIHQRGMHEELMDILRREKAPAGIMHGFSGDAEELKEWLDMGYLICVGRAVLGADVQALRAVVQQIPADSLVLETDGANRLKDGFVEAQDRVIQVAEVVADWRGSSGREIGALATANLKRRLGI